MNDHEHANVAAGGAGQSGADHHAERHPRDPGTSRAHGDGEHPQAHGGSAPHDHRGSERRDHEAAGHAGHGGHGDHVAQFRRLFWWSLVLAVPVVALSPMFAMVVGYSVPTEGVIAWLPAVLGTVLYTWGGWRSRKSPTYTLTSTCGPAARTSSLTSPAYCLKLAANISASLSNWAS